MNILLNILSYVGVFILGGLFGFVVTAFAVAASQNNKDDDEEI